LPSDLSEGILVLELITYRHNKECKWINHRLPRELNFKRACLTSIATRFSVGELIKLSFGPLAGETAYFGIILSIRDSDPYTYSYEIRWINKNNPQIEEIDGIWIERS